MPSKYIKDSTVRAKLREAFRACGLPDGLTWYGASRHTWASQLVMNGGSLAVAQQVLGHSSPSVTMRYAHLKPDLFRPEGLLKVSVSLSRDGGAVIDMAEHRSYRADDQPRIAGEDAVSLPGAGS